MLDILADIRQRLRNKEYHNEEHVRLALVARVVQELGWDIWNPGEVYAEFKATRKEDSTRVDLALFTHDFEATTIFIECKGVGGFAKDLAAVEKQLRDYNRDHTALFTLITDGRHWRFYYSFTSGEFKDKLFCKFDLLTDDLDEVAAYFDTFLRRENIINHSARHKAEAYLTLGKKERAMQDVLPDAQKLVSQPPFPSLPEAMVQLLAAKALTIKPTEAQAFLMGTSLEKIAEPILPVPAMQPMRETAIASAETPIKSKRGRKPKQKDGEVAERILQAAPDKVRPIATAEARSKGGRPANGNKSLREAVLSTIGLLLADGTINKEPKNARRTIASVLNVSVPQINNAVFKLVQAGFLSANPDGGAAFPLALTEKGKTGYETNHGKNIRFRIEELLAAGQTDAEVARAVATDISYVNNIRHGKQ